jgi:hypothetical protein
MTTGRASSSPCPKQRSGRAASWRRLLHPLGGVLHVLQRPPQGTGPPAFIRLVRDGYGIPASARIDIPYARGFLPAYRFTPPAPRSTVVVFGGFDSYIEEFLAILLALADAGHDVAGFEGPGQGSAREGAGLAMTVEWDRPVGLCSITSNSPA